MFTVDCVQWAKEMFSHAYLGDDRRTKRLVSIVAAMSRKIGKQAEHKLKIYACKIRTI